MAYSQKQPIDSLEFKSYVSAHTKFRLLNLDSTKFYINKIDSMTKAYPISEHRFLYFNYLGIAKLREMKLPEALQNIKEAARIAKAISNDNAYITTKINAAAIYGDMGNITKAVTELLELEQYLKATDNLKHKGVSAMYGNLVRYYTQMKEYTKALHYSSLLAKSRKTYKDSITYYIAVQALYRRTNKAKESVRMGLEGLKRLKDTDLFHKYELNHQTAYAYSLLKEYDKAKPLVKEARELAKKLNMETKNIDVLEGEINLKTNNLKTALVKLKRADSLAVLAGMADFKVRTTENLYLTYKKLGDYPNALKYLEEHVLLKDSSQGINQRKAIIELEAKLNLKHKEATILKQQKTYELQKHKTEEQRRLKYIILAFAIVLFLLLSFLFQTFRKLASTTKSLLAERENLKQANKTKDKLFAIISHDLRSPVNTLISYMEAYGDHLNEAYRGIAKSLSGLQLTLNNLLEWARSQIVNEIPALNTTDVEIITDSLITQFKTSIDEKNIKLITLYGHNNSIMSNESYLQIILRNVLSNAIKFTPEGGFIKITTTDTDDGLKITVRDSGKGISKERLEHLFEFPSSTRGTMGEAGTGLGLSLSKELADKLNMDFEIRSKEGMGTEVTLILSGVIDTELSEDRMVESNDFR